MIEEAQVFDLAWDSGVLIILYFCAEKQCKQKLGSSFSLAREAKYANVQSYFRGELECIEYFLFAANLSSNCHFKAP